MTILAFLFVIGILVFIHELGHFLVAKWSGVRVERFSLGFGKKLLGFRRGETEYLISLLPFGGYVKMYGEGAEGNFIMDAVARGSKADKAGFQPGDKILKIEGVEISALSQWRDIASALEAEREYPFTVERDEREVKIRARAEDLDGTRGFSAKDYPRSFSSQPLLNRFLIVVAGPFMNFILPFVFLPIVLFIGISAPAYLERAAEIGYVEPESSGQVAGFQKGDVIVEIDGREIANWRDANIGFQSNPDAVLNVVVEREGVEQSLEVKAAATSDGVVSVGLGETLEAKIDSVVPGTPAERAGVAAGDKIVAIDGAPVSDWYAMASLIRKKTGEEVSVTIERAGERVELKITPEAIGEGGQGAIGITPAREEIIKKYGMLESLVEGVKEAANMLYEVTVLLLTFLYKLITGKISLGAAGKTIAGPLLIAKVSGAAAESGIAPLLQFTCFISINLGLINLLPIPMLDGGHILYMGIEAVKRRPLSQKSLEISQRIGFSFLIFIMFIALYNDISRLKGSILESLSRLTEVFR
ncbi:MAG: RIP metalloprotease RseP [Deltaproteobacteria bacterium]